jgi:20S proteasome alpha/beta subunit
MLPKPFAYPPKPKRLPPRKRMTLVLGLKSDDCVVLGADKEESDQYLKYPVGKIVWHSFSNGWTLGFSGAGSAHLIDYTVQEIKTGFEKTKKVTPNLLRPAIEEVLSRVFKRHIFATNLPLEDRPGVDLIISARYREQLFLIKARDGAPVAIDDFACIGAGDAYAETLLRKFWGVLPMRGVLLMALYVVRQSQKHVCSVGSGTDILILTKTGKTVGLPASLTRPLDEMLDGLDMEFERVFFGALSVQGDWESSVLHFKMNTTVYLDKIRKEMDRLFGVFHLE